MDKKTSTGSFDIVLDTEHYANRDNLCVAFGAGLLRKLGWGAGDWLEFGLEQPGKITFRQMHDSAEDHINARKLKLQDGFYRICFYTALYRPSKPTSVDKEKAFFNLNTRTLTIEVPETCHVPPEVLNRPRELTVKDIAAAFSRL